MKKQIASWIATCGPVGHAKWAPGTLGSMVGILIVLFISKNSISFVGFIFLFFIAVWSSGEVARELHNHDPQVVVIDEVCGIIISFFLISPTWARVVTGFICFRLFDILKPPPLRKFECFPGGLGIVLDDIGAGIYTNIVLQILVRYAHM